MINTGFSELCGGYFFQLYGYTYFCTYKIITTDKSNISGGRVIVLTQIKYYCSKLSHTQITFFKLCNIIYVSVQRSEEINTPYDFKVISI